MKRSRFGSHDYWFVLTSDSLTCFANEEVHMDVMVCQIYIMLIVTPMLLAIIVNDKFAIKLHLIHKKFMKKFAICLYPF